ncbi:hypothetical protein DFH07DRAFT_956414 [Mycena maculata]|uniref:Uncharacterized protein n=1 Tax=Mycena maculata TaxID=230809 RepID=A0AAD7JF61_9AGAR|nr:hypothetical protein DFH07DRAFT_956414 [Mycena maculata]
MPPGNKDGGGARHSFEMALSLPQHPIHSSPTISRMMLASEPSTSGSLPRRHSLTPLAHDSLSATPGFLPVGPLGANAHPSGPAISRRHSLSLMRKPIRSSPLAGPALSSEGEDGTTSRRPPRISSTPDFPSLACAKPHTPPPMLLAPPMASKHLSKRASLLEMIKRPLRVPPPIPLPPPPSSAKLPSNINIIHTPLPPPPRPPPAAVLSFPLPPPSFPRALTAPSTSLRSSTLPLPRANSFTPVYGASVSSHNGTLRTKDGSDNWLTVAPFGPGSTPRFSRLSLASSNVVLPVSARESRRQSVRGEGGKRVSLVYPAAVTPPRATGLIHANAAYSATQSTPSLLTRSRSRSLSSEGPATPSAASSVFGADSVVIEDDEYLPGEQGVDLALVSPHELEVMSQDASSENAHDLPHKPALEPARSTWSLSMKRHRRSHAKGTSFLSLGSGDSTSTMASSPAPSYAPSPLGAETPTIPTPRAQLSPYDAALVAFDPQSEVGHGHSKNAKKGGTMRRLLRSLSGVGRRGR